ncbi:ankyrin repeat-containing protein [Apiospora sp. TS-2023a]
MADPLSIAGLAAGLVSLSLQVTGGITEYLDALKCRAEELSYARVQNESLRKAIAVIQSLLAKTGPQYQSTSQNVADAIKTCESELHTLERIVAGLAGCDTGSWRSRLHERGKKLRYAFDRTKVQQLAGRLSHANEVLSLALQILEVDISQSVLDRLTVSENLSRELAINISSVQLNNNTIVADQHNSTLSVVQQDGDATRTFISAASTQQLGHLEHIIQQSACQTKEMRHISHIVQGLAQRLDIHNNGQFRQSMNPGMMVHRLMEKPSVLREVSDGFGGPNVHPRSLAPLPTAQLSKRRQNPYVCNSLDCLTCTCGRIERSRAQVVASIGPFMWHNETMRCAHSPSCPLARITGDEQRQTFGFRYTGLARILRAAVEISFSLNHGAGGWSLSPNISFRPTVDENVDPVFRVLDLIQRLLSVSVQTRMKPTISQLQEFISSCQIKMLQYLRGGKSSPLATDSQNNSILHILAYCYWYDALYDHGEYLFFDLFKMFISVGAHVNTYNTQEADHERDVAFTESAHSIFRADHDPMQRVVLLNSVAGIGEVEEPDRHILKDASYRAIRLYARHMANRRSRLRQFALQYRPILEAEGYHLGDNEMLDSRAYALVDILAKHHVRLPSALILEAKPSKASMEELEPSPRSWPEDKRRSIYTVLNKPWEANYFWRLGFRDLESSFRDIFVSAASSKDPSYYLWLIEHGASALLQMNPVQKRVGRGKLICAHHIVYYVGRFLAWHGLSPDEINAVESLNNRFLHLGMGDECVCACSIGGCTILVEQLWGLFGCFKESNPNVINMSNRVVWYFDECFTTVPPDFHRAAIRFLTFMALNAVHTCCAAGGGGDDDDDDDDYLSEDELSTEDVEEIEDEQRHILELHEQLVELFEREFFATVGTSTPKWDILDGFWDGFWLPKMQKVLAELNSDDIGEDAKRSAEEIGVVWCKPEPPLDSKNPFDKNSLEYWYFELEGIVPMETTTSGGEFPRE